MTLLPAVLLLSSSASAADFDARVARARAAAATPVGHAYDTALVPAVHAAMTRCVRPGRSAARAADRFTVVASIAANGRVHDVRVHPATPLSRCFAREFSARRLQPPPTDGHPIAIAFRDAF